MSRIGTDITPLIASTLNGVCTPPTPIAFKSEWWSTKVITSQMPTRMMPLPTLTKDRLTITSAASMIPLTLPTSLVSLHPL